MSDTTDRAMPSSNGDPNDASLVSFDDTNDNGAAPPAVDEDDGSGANHGNVAVVPQWVPGMKGMMDKTEP